MNRWLFLLVLGLLWAPSFIFIKIGLKEGIPPITLATARITLAGIILYAILRARGGRLPGTWEMWRRFAVMGFFATALPFALFAIGEQFAASALAAIFNGTTPIATAVIAHFAIEDERLTTSRSLGVLLGFAGILTIFLPELLAHPLGDSSVGGLVAFAIAAVSYGVSIVYGRKHLRGIAPLVAPTAQLIVSSALLIPAAILIDPPMTRVPGPAGIGAVLYLAACGTALAYFLFYRLIDVANATFASLVTYFLPPAGVFLGVIFLDEHIGWSAVAGCLLIVMGLLVVNGIAGRLGRRLRRTPILPAE